MDKNIDKVYLIDGMLFIQIGNNKFPLVKKYKFDNIYYDKDIFTQVMDLLRNNKIPELKKMKKEILDYYEKIDISIDKVLRNEIESEIKQLILEAENEKVRLIIDLKGRAELYYLYVHRIQVWEGCRRQGLGSKYMNKVIEIAKKYNLYIGLDISNALGTPKSKLQRFYKQLGFKKCHKVGIDTEVYL
ncbi:MAG: hypothetical protein K0R54_532 [Clostridiaceae bacterium]|jgi:GNAT superfamily N-acetyltransferase|nr:hypothetical protein [Clostridiaceae bacterium]